MDSPWLTVCNSRVAPTSTPAVIHTRINGRALSMGPPLLPRSESFQNRVAGKHENQSSQKNDPTRKFVEETFGSLRTEVIGQHTSSHDSNGVTDYRDWQH